MSQKRRPCHKRLYCKACVDSKKRILNSQLEKRNEKQGTKIFMPNIDAIVAGAGIWGCTVARRLAEAGRKMFVQERRADDGNVRFEINVAA